MKRPKIYRLSLPAYHVEKIIKFAYFRTIMGYSAYECSFMIGKHDYFVRDIENLLDKSSLSTIDTNYILSIFKKEFSDVFPTKAFDGNYSITLKQLIGAKRKSVYEIIVNSDGLYNSSSSNTIYEEDKHIELPTKLTLSSEEALREFIFSLYNDGFFNDTRTALEIFDECRKEENFGPDFHPRYMIRAINYYTNSKSGEPILDKSRTNLFSRRLFFKAVDFMIDIAKGPVSNAFQNIGIQTFQQAARWVKELPYQRNKDKDNALAIFDDQCGTCSTKHALLKKLADENGNTELRLMLGLFTMNAKNTPAIASILKKYSLEYIPEAHNYLRAYNYILDYTGICVNDTKFELDILEEIEIRPDQITDFKVSYHRDYLAEWIKENKVVYTLDELWKIREECIRAIALSKLEIETERLLLRPFRKEDGATMYALNEDNEVLQYTGDTPFADIAAAESFFDAYDQYEKYSVGRMIVSLKETGETLGWCGLKYDPKTDEYDIGYRFFKKYWGKGYATESALAVMEDGFARLGIKKIVGRARVENSASIRVFDKLEMRFVESFVEDGQDWVLYVIKR